MRVPRLLSVLALVVTAAVGGSSAFAGQAPNVRVKPDTVVSGEKIVVRGSGFKPEARVALLIGPPRSEAGRVGAARTDSDGSFRKRLRAELEPGRWMLLACRNACGVKARDAFVVAAERR